MLKSLKPCSEPCCSNLTRVSYCEQHKRTKPAYDQYRESAAKRVYNGKWRQARLGYLSKHPFCVSCMMEGRRVPATVVDHIKPHKGDMKLFWDSSNRAAFMRAVPQQKDSEGGRRIWEQNIKHACVMNVEQ
ncbi:hypothetical protein BAT02nite_40700 [Bacillus atrophaeus]|nr:hypothetical protein BAT02nite_40700 [Bacillus atrophaeus]